MTSEELDRIEARANAATPGPWHNAGYPLKGIDGPEVMAAGDVHLLTMVCRPSDNEDATFIAHARQDVPRLLDEVARLAAEVERLGGELAETEARAERAEAERDAAVDEARRFRDLVRHQRGPLYDAELITDEEYAALASDAGAVARLRGYDELRRDSLADADKAVAAALEARAKELDDYARDYFPGVEHPSVLSFRNGVHKAASIVRGGR